MRRKIPAKEERLDPVIVEMVNEIGETKWRVFQSGRYLTRGVSIPPISKDFDTQSKAERFYHDNFGWTTTRKYQPSEAPF